MMMFARSRQLLAAAADTLSKTISLSELNTRPVRTATQHRRPKRGGVKDVDLVRNWNILAGDQVTVIAGDAKGEKGIVKRVIRKKNMVIVENVNMNTRIFKPNPEIRGRKYKREGLLHVSNVMLVDPKSKGRTRVKSIFTSTGRKLRVSKSSGSFRSISESHLGLSDCFHNFCALLSFVPKPGSSRFPSSSRLPALSDMVIPRNTSRLIPDRKTRYAPEPSPLDTDPAAASAVTYNVRGEANGVDPLRIQRLKAKKLPLPPAYRSPLRTAGQVLFCPLS